MKKCVRCGNTKDLENDHIIPKSKGGSDDEDNLRVLCVGCHDYRHTRDNILKEIKKQLARIRTNKFNAAKVSMWIFRLGVLEAFNTPELVRARGYKAYYDFPETHYAQWYPQIKLAKKAMDAAMPVIKLTEFIEGKKNNEFN